MIRSGLRRIWPDSLFGRLVTILTAGLFAGQLLTGTIWFETHDNRMLDIPARLFASRLADTLRLLDRAPDDRARDQLVETLSDARYRLTWATGSPLPPDDTASAAQRATAALMNGLLRQRLGEAIDWRLITAHVVDDRGQRRGILSLFESRMPMGDFHAQVRIRDGRWLDIEAHEGQAGVQTEPGRLVIDYLLRIYILRFAAICGIAFIAVRLAIEPLRRLEKAAELLGKNIYRASLPIEGPREVRRAAQSFNAMQRQLLDVFAERTRFLSAVSHDLRSPLTRLRLRTEMLPDATWRERLRGDLDEMEAMVRATLDAVQGIEVTESRERIDLSSMLESLVEDAREAGHDARFDGPSNGIVEGFPRNLKRCLQNLVDNAIRYGGQAEIALDEQAGEWRVVIADRGPGIPDPNLLERVFEPYFRIKAVRADVAGQLDAEPADDQPSGTGLGLTIAQSIARIHGGALTLRNRLVSGKVSGLEATLTLPKVAS